MPPPITSKLATVATLMDDYTRIENDAYVSLLTDKERQLRELVRNLESAWTRVSRLLGRVAALEEALDQSVSDNNSLVEQVYRLENIILEDGSIPAREEAFPSQLVARRLSFDLLTEEEIMDDSE